MTDLSDLVTFPLNDRRNLGIEIVGLEVAGNRDDVCELSVSAISEACTHVPL